MADEVRNAVESARGKIEWLGRRPIEEAMRMIGEAVMLVFPSLAYETFGRSVIESFAKGTPVITSDRGASAELVDNGVTGFTFERGNARSLAERVTEMAGLAARMRSAARAEYLRRYTADQNYRDLMSIYQRVLDRRESTLKLPKPVEAA